jgi:hypothetical protein
MEDLNDQTTQSVAPHTDTDVAEKTCTSLAVKHREGAHEYSLDLLGYLVDNGMNNTVVFLNLLYDKFTHTNTLDKA